jgi:hypothetical protein
MPPKPVDIDKLDNLFADTSCSASGKWEADWTGIMAGSELSDRTPQIFCTGGFELEEQNQAWAAEMHNSYPAMRAELLFLRGVVKQLREAQRALESVQIA